MSLLNVRLIDSETGATIRYTPIWLDGFQYSIDQNGQARFDVPAGTYTLKYAHPSTSHTLHPPQFQEQSCQAKADPTVTRVLVLYPIDDIATLASEYIADSQPTYSKTGDLKSSD